MRNVLFLFALVAIVGCSEPAEVAAPASEGVAESAELGARENVAVEVRENTRGTTKIQVQARDGVEITNMGVQVRTPNGRNVDITGMGVVVDGVEVQAGELREQGNVRVQVPGTVRVTTMGVRAGGVNIQVGN